MKIIVWGLGYVGTVVAACFTELGHEVVGVDKVASKVDALNQGKSPIQEPGVDALIQKGVKSGRLRAMTDAIDEIIDADISLICVGTPSAPDGSTGLKYVKGVAAEIGDLLRHRSNYHVVVVRSTIFPGTTRNVVLPLLEQYSQKKCGEDFGLVMNPEFLREATAIADFYDPPYTVLGEFDHKSGEVVEKLYQGVKGKFFRVSIEAAELLKQTNNAFHALKIGFANEIGRLCDRLDLDSHELMDLVCADTKLNISRSYLRPGFAFGGSCLPKDLRSITFHAQKMGVEMPIMESILPSNLEQIEAARLKVHELNVKSVTVLGISFKAYTDDLRESPMLTLINHLWQDGLDVRVYDPKIQLGNVSAGNQYYLERQLPQFNQIVYNNIDEAISSTDTVILSHSTPEFEQAIQNLPPYVAVIDLVRPHLSYGRPNNVIPYQAPKSASISITG